MVRAHDGLGEQCRGGGAEAGPGDCTPGKHLWVFYSAPVSFWRFGAGVTGGRVVRRVWISLGLFCFSYRGNGRRFVCVCEWASGEGTMCAEEHEEAELGEVRKQTRPGLRAVEGSQASPQMIHPQEQERRQPKRK